LASSDLESRVNESEHQTPAPIPVFATTHWTLVLRAKGDDPEASAALGELCQIYWNPVFRFLRREGRDEDNARDLTQEFFARLLARGGVDHVQRERGRFRSYLLGAVKHFLADQRRAEGRQKRGEGTKPESLDARNAAGGESTVRSDDHSLEVSDAFFDRHWALAVMDRALAKSAEALKASGNEQQFELLKPWLMGDAEGLSQADVAVKLDLTPGALKVAIHRLRKRFREAVRQEIAQTVDEADEIDGELRHLVEALSQTAAFE
jgi:RNA polymerase sigma factor (sigma-70 family)